MSQLGEVIVKTSKDYFLYAQQVFAPIFYLSENDQFSIYGILVNSADCCCNIKMRPACCVDVSRSSRSQPLLYRSPEQPAVTKT